MRTELYTVVDQGGIVVDVAVENSLYGELRGTHSCRPGRWLMRQKSARR